jgi:7-cyano-7-deazaguanine synthase in queuosine biosynthesis
MRRRVPLSLPGDIRIDATPLMETYAAWFDQLAPVSLVPAGGGNGALPRGGRTAAFFTGGVDSFFTLDSHRAEIDAIVCVLGFDVRPKQRTLWEATRRTLEIVADAYGVDAVVVETDIRAYLDPCASWEVTHGAALAAIAHLLGHEFGRVMISSSFSTSQPILWGSHPELDPLWSTPALSIEHVGADTSRLDKLRTLAGNEVALSHLRVCWRNPRQAYNCGRCSKCVRTRLGMDALGFERRCTSFDGRLSARDIRHLDGRSRAEAYFLTEVADEYDRVGAATPTSKALRGWLRDHWGRASRVSPAPPRRTSDRRDRLVVEEPRVEVDADETRLHVGVRRGAERATFEVRMGLGGREPSRVGDALLLWFVLPAMRTATALEIQAPVSPELLERVGCAQEIWSHLGEFEGHLPVPVEAPVRGPGPPPALSDPSRPWAAAFSSGVDAFDVALQHRDRLAHLVTVHGITQLRVDPDDLAVTTEWLHAGARAVGLPLIEVSTNYRSLLVERLGCRWDYAFVLSKYGLAHFLHPHVGGLLIAAESDYRDVLRMRPTSKYNPLLDEPTSSHDVRIRIGGLTRSRLEKLRGLCEHPQILDALWVCHQRYVTGYSGGRNCGTCEKCIRTLTMLRLLRRDEDCTAFDRPFDLETLRKVRIPAGAYSPSRRLFYRQMLAAARGRKDARDVAAALEDVVQRFPASDPLAPALADALVTRYPLLAASTAGLRRTLGRWVGRR